MGVLNPFSQSIISDAWQSAEADVPGIHADVFALCCSALDYVRESGNSRSVLVHGLPGSGKTHLLSRFRAHLTGESPPTAGGRPTTPSVLFTAVRLRAGPRMMCRHLRRTLAGDLFRATGDGMLQLERVLLHRLARYFKSPEKAQKWWTSLRQPESARKWWQSLRASDGNKKTEEQVDALIERLDEEAEIGRSLCTVLRHLALGQRRRDVRDWLREGVLPEAVMQELGLAPDPEDEDPEQQALQVVCALSRLADEDVPLVLCFDQLEALQTHPEDVDGLFAFGQMVSSLRDKTRNTLFISCVQTAFLDTLNQVIRGADMDRLAEKEGLLKPLSLDEAERLVVARLEASTALLQERKKQTLLRLWPLRTDRLKGFVQSSGACTPRQLIAFCDDEFEAWRQGKVEPALPVDEFLEIQYRTEQDRALDANDPQRTNEILAHGLPLALELLALGRPVLDPAFKDLDLVVDTPSGRRWVGFCNQNGSPLTRRLKRLQELVERREIAKLLLVRDSRLAISKYAKKAREHIKTLERLGVPLIRPTPEALAALEAFRTLLSDAKAGDLATHGEVVPTDTVRRWLAVNVSDALWELLQQLLHQPKTATTDKLYDDLLELVQQCRVLRVATAAEVLDCELDEVAACVQRHLDRFGFLPGPPSVVFELVPETTAAH